MKTRFWPLTALIAVGPDKPTSPAKRSIGSMFTRKAANAALALLTVLSMTVISGVAHADVVTGTRVTGGGQFTDSEFGSGLTRVTVHAIRHQDGTVTGQVEQHMPDIGVSFHGEVNCLHVIGNTAYVSGVITKVQKSPDSGYGSGFLEGTFFILAIEDNGEGRNAPPDRVSLIYFGDAFDGPFDCAGEYATFFTSLRAPIDRGNFQVVP